MRKNELTMIAWSVVGGLAYAVAAIVTTLNVIGY